MCCVSGIRQGAKGADPWAAARRPWRPPSLAAGVSTRGGADGPPVIIGSEGGPQGRGARFPGRSGPALGLDFGSRSVKLVYGREGSRLMHRVLDSLEFFRRGLRRREGRLSLNWDWLGMEEVPALVVTGYGKHLVKAHFATITEVRASFLGVRWATGLADFTLLEMGGQDTKVLLVKGGRVFDFLTNDRCAAGTGRYLENMARFLKMPLREFSRAWEDPVEISQTCAIFGESELIGHLLTGTAPARLATGVNASVARRALALVQRYPSDILVFAGGVAKNRAIGRLLQAGGRRLLVPTYPQFMGALGCYLEALEHLYREVA